MEITIPIEILWGDADPSGWVYYAAVLRYIAEAEAKLYRKIGMMTNHMIKKGYANPRVHLSINYITPFKVHDEGYIHAWIDKIGTSSVTMAFEMTDINNSNTYIKGELVTVIVDIVSEKAIPIPNELRNNLLKMRK